MDWKLVATTFGLVFLAELGDKTQLATFGIASSSAGGKWAVFVGSTLALAATSAIAVVAGALVGRHVPQHWVLRVSGLAFVALGAWSVWRSFAPTAGAS